MPELQRIRCSPTGDAVMEIKSSGPFPLWLVRALDACEAYPTSFSKYGEAYRACMAAYRGAPSFATARASQAAAEQKAEPVRRGVARPPPSSLPVRRRTRLRAAEVPDRSKIPPSLPERNQLCSILH